MILFLTENSPDVDCVYLTRMRKQAERWGAELHQEDVEFIDLKNRPFTVKSSERKVMLVLVVFISLRLISGGAFLCC